MTAGYELTPAAKRDLRAIWIYTEEQWGEPQADRYLGHLEACFRRLAGGRARARAFSGQYPHVRVTRCQHHYVFFIPREGQPPLVIAVLHERMDLLGRIGERLDA